LPENVTFEEGAFVEPLAVVAYAATQIGLTVGQNVLICGAGGIGLLSFLVAKAYGVAKVLITGLLSHSCLSIFNFFLSRYK